MDGATYLGNGVTVERFYFGNVGFPFLLRPKNLLQMEEDVAKTWRDSPSFPVFVEVHKVDDNLLRRLDSYEGVPRLYTRDTVKVKLFKNGTKILVETGIYIGSHGLSHVQFCKNNLQSTITMSDEGTVWCW